MRKRPADKNEASFLKTLIWLIKRRLLGLFAFFSGTAAMLTYVTFYAGSRMDLTYKPCSTPSPGARFIPIGGASWLLLFDPFC